MAVNVDTTTALLTSSQRIMPAQLRLRGQDVEWRTCVRYLGVSNVLGTRALNRTRERSWRALESSPLYVQIMGTCLAVGLVGRAGAGGG
ncbi:hypothetical protein EVAR_48311_1 [Eumeta japonica]|uniref:Uncharacterized protein n=1 Tax=Eumeta variegata TaxID=151549 RepID=A0A4C1WJU3_EUMVA|nr:hypothetical protein EVAR_48311_1 [Eumeta japonica]